ncbi:MAG: GAF domain-containing protein [Armatimonadetes bacterium]|nr:GAF domain-containing protein [Armatimonadota bacterium]NDK14261.1 GAF domain-containing protein [Armatimonadota bacterium]
MSSPSAPTARSAKACGVRVLLVEDNPTEAFVLRETLEAMAFARTEVTCAGRLDAALRHLEAGGFDLALLDLGLPDSQGMETLERLRARAPGLPVVALTGTGDEALFAEALRKGAQDYLVKGSVDGDGLGRAVRYALERGQQQRACRESEARYRTLFERVPVGLYRFGKDGGILDANPALLEMLGYPDCESLQATGAVGTYADPQDRIRLQEALEQAGVVRGFQTRLRRRDGTEIDVEDDARVVRGPDGEVLCYEGSLQEITDRKRAESDARRQSAVVAAINRLFREALNCDTEAEIGQTCLAVASKLTGSTLGFLGNVTEDNRFDVLIFTASGWNACEVPKSNAGLLLQNMEIRGVWGRPIREKRSVIVNAPATDPVRVGVPEGHPEIKHFLGVPLKQGADVVGMIALAHKEGGYTATDQEVMDSVAAAFTEAPKPQTRRAGSARERAPLSHAHRARLRLHRRGR